jgi:hypothetical protein
MVSCVCFKNIIKFFGIVCGLANALQGVVEIQKLLHSFTFAKAHLHPFVTNIYLIALGLCSVIAEVKIRCITKHCSFIRSYTGRGKLESIFLALCKFGFKIVTGIVKKIFSLRLCHKLHNIVVVFFVLNLFFFFFL